MSETGSGQDRRISVECGTGTGSDLGHILAAVQYDSCSSTEDMLQIVSSALVYSQ